VAGGWQSTVIAPCSGKAWRLGAGQRLRIIDLEGSQSGDLFAVAADDVEDGQSNGRTFDMGGTIRLSTGSLLYSRRSRPLLRITEDEVGVSPGVRPGSPRTRAGRRPPGRGLAASTSGRARRG